MGSQLSRKDSTNKTEKVSPDNLQWKFYTKHYVEGSEDLPEDPDFPKELMERTTEWTYNGPHHALNGTNVYYPNKDKIKLWVGEYKVLNPADWICNPYICGEDANAKCNFFCGTGEGGGEEENYKNTNSFSVNENVNPAAETCNIFSFWNNQQYNNNYQLHPNVEMTNNKDCMMRYTSNVNSECKQNFYENELNAKMQNAVRVATGQQFGQQNWKSTLHSSIQNTKNKMYNNNNNNFNHYSSNNNYNLYNNKSVNM